MSTIYQLRKYLSLMLIFLPVLALIGCKKQNPEQGTGSGRSDSGTFEESATSDEEFNQMYLLEGEMIEFLNTEEFQAMTIDERVKATKDFLESKEGTQIIKGSLFYDDMTYQYHFKYRNGRSGKLVIYEDEHLK